MSGSIHTKGLEQVMAGLDKALSSITNVTRRGVIAGGLFIQAEAQKRCPVDTGNLKNSAFTVWGETLPNMAKFKGPKAVDLADEASTKIVASNQACKQTTIEKPIKVKVGFTAFYAIYVHEDLAVSHLKSVKETFKGPKVKVEDGTFLGNIGEAKFLEKAVLLNKGNIIRIIALEVTAQQIKAESKGLHSSFGLKK